MTHQLQHLAFDLFRLLVLVTTLGIGSACPGGAPGDDGGDGGDDAGPDCDESDFYPDTDGDGHGDADAAAVSACEAPTGSVAVADDCDDSDGANFPGNTEICDDADNDCDGDIDDGLPRATFFADLDGDTYGDADAPLESCAGAPVGTVADDSDCDDDEALRFPGNTEVCDLIDNDCDTDVDEGVQLTFFADADGDGHGDANASVLACAAPANHVANSTDCDDADNERSPDLGETCDLKDNNCDGGTDEGVTPTWYDDPDGDGYAFNDAASVLACTQPPNTTPYTGDCDEENPDVNPGRNESDCDFIDTNCDGTVGETVVPDAYATLQAAVDATATGGLICLRAGTYVGTTTVSNKELRIVGAGSDDEGTPTILDGNLAGSVLHLSLAGASVVEHVRITRGQAQIGAGLHVIGGAPTINDVVAIGNSCTTTANCLGTGLTVRSVSSATLTDITADNNTAISTSSGNPAAGGGVALIEANATTVTGLRVRNNTVSVTNNGTITGVGLMVRYGNVTLRDVVASGNTVTGNTTVASIVEFESGSFDVARMELRNNSLTSGYGTVLYTNNASPMTVKNVVVANNTGNSAAVEFSNTPALLSHLTVAFNMVGGTGVRPALVFSGVAATVASLSNSIVANNVGGIQVRDNAGMTPAYNDFFSNGPFFTMPDPTGMNGNINAAPGFVNGPGGGLQLVPGAAAADAGDPAAPLDLNGTRADMGAYGGPEATPPN